MLDATAIGAPVMITEGFTLAESPIWDHCGHQLLFSDVQGGTGAQGVVHTLSTSGTLGVFADGTTNANGIAFDVDGSLIMSQMGGGGHIARREKSGTITVLEEMGGPNLHTPDDVTVKSDGTIYFSDGDFYPIGNLLGYATQLPVYMLKPGTSTLVKVATVGGPNGIEFGPNEDTLLVSAYGEGTIYKFTPGPDGMLTKTGSLITGLDKNDSMCLDAAGNVYVGVHTGLQILRADGSKVKLLPIPGYTTTTGTTSCTFGGDDGKTLYITSWTTIYKVEGMPIPGLDWQVNNTRFACN
jgi:gluconolactonase